MEEVMYTRSRQVGESQPLFLFETALIDVCNAVGRLRPEVKGGQMNDIENEDLSWMIVCTVRGSHVKQLPEFEIQLFERTWEDGLVRALQAALAHLAFHHRAELEERNLPYAHFGRRDEEGLPTIVPYVCPLGRHAGQMEFLLGKTQNSLDICRMEKEMLTNELGEVKQDLEEMKRRARRQRKLKLRAREAKYMLKVKVKHLKTALREAETKIEELEDDGEDLRKENAALLSDDDDYMDEEGYDWNNPSEEEDEDDMDFINDEPEEPAPPTPRESSEEEDPEEPPFEEPPTKDDTIILDDD
jgi:hypothetical protein